MLVFLASSSLHRKQPGGNKEPKIRDLAKQIQKSVDVVAFYCHLNIHKFRCRNFRAINWIHVGTLRKTKRKLWARPQCEMPLI